MHPTRSVPRRALLCAAALLGLLGTGAVHAWGAGERVTGSGKPAAETRALAGYDAIKVAGNFDVVVRASGREGIEVRGDDNLLPLLESRLEGTGGKRTLVLSWREGVSVDGRSDLVVTVDVAALRALSLAGSGSVTAHGLKTPALALSLAGSGDIEMNGLQADDCSVTLAGSGDISLAGRATSLAVSVAGSGDVDAQRLEASAVSVKVAGSGEVAVHANQTLTVSIAGSGDVGHRGAAQPQASVMGSGRVRRL